MSKITDKILDTIKSKHIAPKPRWHFVLRQIMLWFVTVISIIVGSLSFSAILFRVVNNDWEILRFINKSPITHAINTLPYIWIIILLIFIGLAYYNTLHTKGAYKHRAYYLVLISVVISLVLGGIFYAIGFGPCVHDFSNKITYIKEVMHNRQSFWMAESDGLIAGEVIHMLSGVGMFGVEDLNDKYWIIRPGNEYYPPPRDFVIEEGAMIKIFGEKIDEEIFEAKKVFPYEMGPGTKKGIYLKGELCEKFGKCRLR